jgi:hypothetical protein
MKGQLGQRNAEQAARIAPPPAGAPLRFVVTGGSSATPNPTADAIFQEQLAQMGRLDPRPAFLLNLGDFAGPGTRDRHEHYMELVEGLPMPDICMIGNHETDDPVGLDSFHAIHGDPNFAFAVGDVLFAATACRGHSDGPSADDVERLADFLAASDHRVRVVLVHVPPYLDGHYAPHPDWGFRAQEDRFLELLREHAVDLVCASHIMAYDLHVHDGIPFLATEGGGWGVCSHFGICNGERPPRRASFFHFVEVTIGPDQISGRLIRAHHGTTADEDYSFAFEL